MIPAIMAGPGSRLYVTSAPTVGNAVQSLFALEVLCPKASGSAPTGLDSGNRIFRAYPGVPYRVPLSAVGGYFPYVEWTTNNGTIEEYTDQLGNTQYMLVFSNPTSNFSYAVTVEDANGATASSGTVNVVVATTNWHFVDSNNAAGGRDGSVSNPWNSLAELQAVTTANTLAYFRTGTYLTTGLTVENANDANGEERCIWNSASAVGGGCNKWIAYPGETPVLDYAYAGGASPYTGKSKPRMRMVGPAIWVEGMTLTNAMCMAFQMGRTSNQGVVVWNNTFEGCGPGISGGNSSFIMWISGYGSSDYTDPGSQTPGSNCYGDLVLNNVFDNSSAPTATLGVGAMIMYSMEKPLIEGNRMINFAGTAAHAAIKAAITDFTFRGNSGGTAATPLAFGMVGGNQDAHVIDEECMGDIIFNLGFATDHVIAIGAERINVIKAHNVQRNTCVGPMRVVNVATADGVYTIDGNIFQNALSASTPWAGISDEGTNDTGRVTYGDNLAAASGLVDSSGIPVNPDHIGVYGHYRP